MGRKETEDAIAEARAGGLTRFPTVEALMEDLNREVEETEQPTQTRPRYTLDELLAECDYSQPRTPEEQEWLDAPPVGRELL